MNDESRKTTMHDVESATGAFLADTLEGLAAPHRSLSCKYFYDERGAQLFEEICKLDEYYLTRAELAIMRRDGPAMAERLGYGVMLVELGSGASVKTRVLLEHLRDPAAYVPVDISREHLQETAGRLSRAYPALEVLPVCADFTESFDLPSSERAPRKRAVYFPGSTIGNFEANEARALLGQIAAQCSAGGGLLIGIDLEKDAALVEAAYNDSKGVTAEFNRNLLHRINRELGADFEVSQFRHVALYNAGHRRIEMYLVSERDQTVSVGGQEFSFRQGEKILTEYSHKYTLDEFRKMAAEVDLTLTQYWTDEEHLFAVLYFDVN